ncbi:MAG: hypothetical protein KBD31_04270 [Proteobacteria bacterium]|nr:hypothetical protein [Pseudomonadota bacterium]
MGVKNKFKFLSISLLSASYLFSGYSPDNVNQLLNKAIPKSPNFFDKCPASLGSAVNWQSVQDVENNATDKNSAQQQIANFLKDRINPCLKDAGQKNFLLGLEKTCTVNTGSTNQQTTCKTVASLLGRENGASIPSQNSEDPSAPPVDTSSAIPSAQVLGILNNAVPKSINFLDRCSASIGKAIKWNDIKNVEDNALDKNYVNTTLSRLFSERIDPCLNAQNPKFLGGLEQTCQTDLKSTKQKETCVKVSGITKQLNVVAANNQQTPNADPAEASASQGTIIPTQVTQALNDAIPKSANFIDRCGASIGKGVNWATIKRNMDGALDKSKAQTDFNGFFNQRITPCLVSKNTNFLNGLEATCQNGVGLDQQKETCRKVKGLLGRSNPVADGTDSYTLQGAITELKATPEQQQLDAATAQNTQLEAQLKDAQDKLAAATTDAQALAQKQEELNAEIQKYTDATAQYEAATKQYTDVATQYQDVTAQYQNAVSQYQTAEEQLKGQYTSAIDQYKNAMDELGAYRNQLDEYAKSLSQG